MKKTPQNSQGVSPKNQRKYPFKVLPRCFKGHSDRSSPAKNRQAFPDRNNRISRRTHSTVAPLLTRKENSCRSPRRRPRLRLCRHSVSTSWFGNINPIPFRQAGRSENHPPPNGTDLSLRIDSPMSNCCSHGTFPHFGLQSSHLNICYYHQDLH